MNTIIDYFDWSFKVFVDMTKKERYANKIVELYETIKRKDASKQKVSMHCSMNCTRHIGIISL